MSDLKALQRPRFARQYLRSAELADLRGAAEHRAKLVAGLSGRVMEVGAGQGLNFRHYPDTVTELVAVEPDDTLRKAADRNAAAVAVPVRVVAGQAARLPGESGAFDAVVASLVLCTVDDVPAALAELARVLRPGGQLRFYEHVRAQGRLTGVLEDLVNPLWRRAAAGCNINRDTETAIAAAGFRLEHVERFGFSSAPLVPRSAHIIGTALRP